MKKHAPTPDEDIVLRHWYKTRHENLILTEKTLIEKILDEVRAKWNLPLSEIRVEVILTFANAPLTRRPSRAKLRKSKLPLALALRSEDELWAETETKTELLSAEQMSELLKGIVL